MVTMTENFKCFICDGTFASENALYQHVTIERKRPCDFKCGWCGTKLRSKYLYDTHTKKCRKNVTKNGGNIPIKTVINVENDLINYEDVSTASDDDANDNSHIHTKRESESPDIVDKPEQKRKSQKIETNTVPIDRDLSQHMLTFKQYETISKKYPSFNVHDTKIIIQKIYAIFYMVTNDTCIYKYNLDFVLNTYRNDPNRRRVPSSMKTVVAANNNWTCNICDMKLSHAHDIDHIISLCEGGSNDANNLQPLCKNCHGLKSKIDIMFRNNTIDMRRYYNELISIEPNK